MISEQTLSDTITLVATSQSGSTHQYQLEPDQGVFVGSSAQCGLQLPGNDLAGIQCHITIEENKLWIQEWMSAEGTRINGQLISDRQQVQVGDVIQIGKHQIAIANSQSLRDSIAGESEQTAQVQTQETVAQAEPPEVTADSAAETLGDEIQQDDEIPQDDEVPQDDEIPQDDGVPQDVAEPRRVDSKVLADETIVTEVRDSDPAVSMELDDDVFDFDAAFEEEETYDRETVALMRAEIEDLQAALAQRDAERFEVSSDQQTNAGQVDEASDEVLQRMRELVDEANRSDERVAVLEEMLHASEDANRSEQEERHHLEAWVGDIEKRIGQREDEHVAELEAMRQRLEEASEQIHRLQQKLRQAAQSGSAPKQYEETLENLQQSNEQLQEQLAESQKRCLALEQRLEEASDGQERALRDERAAVAKEQAKVSRLRHELSGKLAAIEEIPKSENQADKETAQRIQALRQHLREIHEQEKAEQKDESLATRLSKLWKRVDEY